MKIKASIACWLLVAGLTANAAELQPVPASPQLEANMIKLSEQLRCLVCQNQTIADSQAPLAVDLRQHIREQLVEGRTEDQILRYMTERYGEYVLYRPPFKATTWLLWVGPFILLVCGVLNLFRVLRRRRKNAPASTLGVEDQRRLEALLRRGPRSDKS